MAEPRYPIDRASIERWISAASASVEEAQADCHSIEEIIARTRAASEAEARLAEAIEGLDAPPRFFFHFRWSEGFTPDHCGVALPDLAAALRWAVTEARHLAEPEWPLGFDPITGIIIIADENGTMLEQVMVRDVLDALSREDRTVAST
jgi:hypothetical protein